MPVAVALAVVLADRLQLPKKTVITLLDYNGFMVGVLLWLSN